MTRRRGLFPARAHHASFAVACLLLGVSRPALAAKICEAPWRHLPESGREVLRPLPVTMIGAAAVAPIVLIPTNADHDLRRFAQTDLGGSYQAEQVSLYTPYVLFPTLLVGYGGAALAGWCPEQKRLAAMIQATTVTAATYAMIKVISGRAWPVWNVPEDLDLDDPGRAREFTPFQRIEQELGAFPSGHTAFMFAAAAALRASSPELGLWRYSGYPLAFGMGFAMWFGDYHWASDVVSGALLGEAMGASVGRAFAAADVGASRAVDRQPVEVTWLVLPTPGGAAVSVAGAF